MDEWTYVVTEEDVMETDMFSHQEATREGTVPLETLTRDVQVSIQRVVDECDARIEPPDLGSQWEALQERRRQCMDTETALRRRLMGLTSEPDMRQLLEEKTTLRKQIPHWELDASMHEGASRNDDAALERRRRALNDKRVAHELSARLKEHRIRLAKLQSLNAPEMITDHETRMIWVMEAPLVEVQEFYRLRRIENEGKRQEAQRVLDEALEHIDAINAHYRDTKKALEDGIRAADEARRSCLVEEIEWATQDRAHLEWTVEHQPSHRHDVLRRYKERFPDDDVSEPVPPPIVESVIAKRNTGKRETRKAASEPIAAENVPPQPWTFSVTFRPGDHGQPLPQDPRQFQAKLRFALNAQKYRTLKPEIVLQKLIAETLLPRAERQDRKQIAGEEVDPELDGWKILRAGDHRLFLLINEQTRTITFLPRPRKEAYRQM